MKVRMLSAVVLCAASMQALADKEYWLGTDGEYARDRNGHCVRTLLWTPEAAIAGCEGEEDSGMAAKAAPAPAAEKAMDTAKKEAPAVKKAVAPAVVAAPAYKNLSLSSGATFELGGSTLSSEGKAAVAALLSEFEGEEIHHVVVEGYTDDRGAASFNQHLSENRAKAVKTELVANGINADMIEIVGFGESDPIADNNTREGRSKNRRVEIKVDAKTRQL